MNVDPTKVVDAGIVGNLVKKHEQIQQNGVDLTLAEETTIPANSFENVLFNEVVSLPQGLMALFNVRSSYSRMGIFTSTGVWDAGYEGVTGCTIYNMRDEEITLDETEKIGQMIFFTSDSTSTYDGQYNNNEDIESKLE